MPTFQFEAMDATGAEIKDVIEAPTEEEAQATIRQMGYFVTKITAKKARKKAEATGGKKKRGFVFGGVKSRELTTFTRQLSILQDAGLPILRSLRIGKPASCRIESCRVNVVSSRDFTPPNTKPRFFLPPVASAFLRAFLAVIFVTK